MDNHVHFVLEPKSKKGLSKLFNALNTKYVKYYHKKYNVRGRFWGSRYFSCLLNEDHFYEALRYVKLNPYKAKMENEIGNYKWSSVQERLGRRNRYFLSKLPTYMKIENWKEYLLEKLPEIVQIWQRKDHNEIIQEAVPSWDFIRMSTIAGKAAGSSGFIEKMSEKIGRYLGFNKKGLAFANPL